MSLRPTFHAILPTLVLIACTTQAETPRAGREAVYANERGTLSLTLRAGLGVAQGQARETVYYDDPELGERFKLSELLWDIEDVVVAGGCLTARIGPKFRIEAAYWTAITEGEGRMDDDDWMYGPGEWSDWSLSEVEVRDTSSFDLRAALEVLRAGPWGLSAVAGYREDRWGWDDQIIRYIYSSEGFRDDAAEVDGVPAITYEQRFRIPYAGIALGYDGSRLGAEVYFHYSPLVEAEDKDYHILRDTHFATTAENGDYYGVGIRATGRLTEQISARVAAEWQVVEEMVGDMEINSAEGTEVSYNGAGLASDWMLLSLSLGYTF